MSKQPKEGKAYIGDEIVEGNKLIAEFMGYRTFSKRYPRNHGIGAPEAEYKDMIVEKAKYHSSWDWIVPVVQKITAINLPNTPENNSALYPVFKSWEIIALHPIWESVVQFIQWYNNQNKQS